MRIWLFSDLHLPNGRVDLDRVLPTIPDADVCIVAGDLIEGRPDDGVEWLDDNIGHAMPVLYVLGNHEFYDFGRDMETARGLAQRAAWRTSDRVHVLDDMAVTIGGVRFLGSTMWYDLEINGSDDAAMARAYQGADLLTDSRFLAHGTTRWSPTLARAQHLKSRAWLEQELAASDVPTVVVTHHAPHPGSIAPEYEMDLATAAFVSDLSDLITRHRPALWLHGHVHNSFDYHVGDTRIVCNPKGYGRENQCRFDPSLVIEIEGYEPKPPGV